MYTCVMYRYVKYVHACTQHYIYICKLRTSMPEEGKEGASDPLKYVHSTRPLPMLLTHAAVQETHVLMRDERRKEERSKQG